MSPKPTKKSDASKRWMQPRRDSRINILPEYHLIISEGAKTEPNYFAGLQRELDSKGKGRIKIRVEGEGANTLSLINRAQEHIRADNNPIRHVWLAYDRDSFPADDFDNTLFKWISQNKDDTPIKYHALWSNQCIELWFLLHFSYHQEDVHRSEYKPMLDRHLNAIDCGDYKKKRDDIYDVLRPYLPTAIENAKKLRKFHNNPAPSKNAPGTTVYEIFDFLSPYL